MQTERPVSKKQLSVGRILSGLAVVFLVWDGVIKLMMIAPVVESFERLGYRVGDGRAVGVLELCCVALYVAPRTASLGAVLLTGFLGGAVATHMRTGDPLLTHVLFPTYVGLFVWAGLLLREPKVRVLIPSRRSGSRDLPQELRSPEVAR